MIDQPTLADLNFFTEIAVNLGDIGGDILRRYWGNIKQVEIVDKKIVGDLVTEADKESERQIISFLKNKCPSHAVLAEESGSNNLDSDYLWIIDPLDRTTNYAHQYPCVSVSIALIYKGEPIIGVVYNPIQEELFQATLGQGSFLNGKKISVSFVNSLEKSLLVTGFPYDRRGNLDNNYREFCHLTNLSQGVRRSGSAALDLAFVASGRVDAYWEKGIKPWDIVAGVLIVEEAGGQISNYEGKAFDLYSGEILASNTYIHKEMVEQLKKEMVEQLKKCTIKV